MNSASRMSFLGVGLTWLRSATITVLGAGGGGSHIAQQVAHLGVRRLILVDPDRLEDSNVNRVVGVGYGDIGEYKASLLADRFADLKTEIIPEHVRAESPIGRRWIEQSDVVFVAVDGARARRNIEAICRAALVPCIDVGLKIALNADGVTVDGIGGQVVTSLPGEPCLWCAGVITEAALLADREEYVAGQPEQQVVSMNGILASQAVSGMLAVMSGYAPNFPLPAMITYDGLDHIMKPDTYVQGPCTHYPVEEAGWRDVLPRRRAAA
jgi:hypothetical protein